VVPDHKIVFAGGGTSGHVVPNLALIEELTARGWQAHYLGTADGIEAKLVRRADIPFVEIHAGKLRRYWNWKTLAAPGLTLLGTGEATAALRRLRPSVVFSKGGFAAFPVSVAAWLTRIPLILHESDLTPGLATRLALPFATHVCTAFPETARRIGNRKPVTVTGTPMPRSVQLASAERAVERFKLAGHRPTLLVFGGSLGSMKINAAVRDALPTLLQSFEVVHICGPGRFEPRMVDVSGYLQLEYVHEGFHDLMARSEIVVSRGGANTLEEIQALKKPHVIVPLGTSASRGDQIVNARFFARRFGGVVLADEELDPITLVEAITRASQSAAEVRQRLEEHAITDAVQRIVQLIEEVAARTG
jgi:UDP-N-acetylglucosamine--N-acetylmuramyl-(pentapeptide) pyrophosphoryl-undecaprenol N-acetylglucosamine transferase